MVYKKVVKRIPSLSSLLLTGVVLSGCPDPKKPDSGNGNANVAQAAGNTGLIVDDAGRKFGADFLKPFHEIWAKFLDWSSLGHLNKAPIVMEQSDFEGPHAKQRIEEFCRSFSSDAYPSTLRRYLEPLSNLEFATGGARAQTKHKAAYGKALTPIAKVWFEFHTTYDEMQKAIKNNSLVTEQRRLLNELKKFYESHVKAADGTTSFRSDMGFANPKKEGAESLFSGGKMARFLSTYTTKGSQVRVSDILNKSVESVWVRLKAAGSPDALNFNAPDPLTTDFLKKRGACIANNWYVEKEDSKMPAIAGFPNGEDVYAFDFTTGRLGAIVAADAVNADAVKQASLTFGQLLFTLFRGSSAGDFFNLDVIDGKQKIKLTTDNEHFAKLVAVSKGSPDAFAQYLGAHIESNPELKKLFFIPDIDTLKENILEGVPLVYDTQPANEGGMAPDAGDPYGTLSATAWSAFLLRNILNSQGQVDTLRRIVLRHANLVTIAGKNQANVTFEQRVRAKLADKVRHDGSHHALLMSIEAGSARNLLNALHKVIQEEVSHAICCKTDGTYQATLTTRKMLLHFNELLGALSDKHKAPSFTYADIGTDTGDRFDIAKILDGMEKDYRALQSLLNVGTNISGVLREEKDEKVDYADYFPDIEGLVASRYPILDKIRLGYQKAETAPVAPAA